MPYIGIIFEIFILMRIFDIILLINFLCNVGREEKLCNIKIIEFATNNSKDINESYTKCFSDEYCWITDNIVAVKFDFSKYLKHKSDIQSGLLNGDFNFPILTNGKILSLLVKCDELNLRFISTEFKSKYGYDITEDNMDEYTDELYKGNLNNILDDMAEEGLIFNRFQFEVNNTHMIVNTGGNITLINDDNICSEELCQVIKAMMDV